MKRWDSFLKGSRGSVAAITIVMMVAFFGLLAIVIDLGHLMLVRNQLQNAADAGALAGARALYLNNTTGTPDWAAGQAAALSAVQLNKADTQYLVTAQVQTGYWNTTWSPSTAPANLLSTGIVPGPTDAPAVKVTVQKMAGSNNGPVALTFGQIFGISTVNVGGLATARVLANPGGPFNFTLFSNLNFPINGSNTVTGSAGTNGLLSINGSENITANAYGVGGVNINGSETIGSAEADTASDISVNGTAQIGSQSGGATTIAMPNYSSQIAATATTIYNGNEVFNGNVNATGNIYVTGTATINGSLTYSGALLATGNITVNGSAAITGSNQIFLYSANGNIVINGSENLANGDATIIVYAPNGTVTLNGSFNLNGIVVANRIILNGSQNINGNFPITALQQFGLPELVQ